MSADDYDSWQETVYLLRSPENARRLMEAVARMEDVASAMEVIGSTTKEVDRIAFGIRILALNAKIESVHVGERGAGFAVVG